MDPKTEATTTTTTSTTTDAPEGETVVGTEEETSPNWTDRGERVAGFEGDEGE